ncbi:MAG: hypothetical protein HN712_15860 [Gemmatimonadetes bacterium]|nr:hypothetical protein [Gemmatimonadota bacterium]
MYPFSEISDAELALLDLFDGSVEDWRRVMGPPTLTARRDFYGEDGLYFDHNLGGRLLDPVDADWEVWFAWNETRQQLFITMELIDDDFQSTFAGGIFLGAWRNDYMGFVVDGDHSGGQFFFWRSEDADKPLHVTAQHYQATPDAPDGIDVGMGGFPSLHWAHRPPFADGQVTVNVGGPTVYEFSVTAFDSLVYDSPGESIVSQLRPGGVIGFHFEFTDHDAGQPQLTFVLGPGFGGTNADDMKDAILLPHAQRTDVAPSAWGDVKLSPQDRR